MTKRTWYILISLFVVFLLVIGIDFKLSKEAVEQPLITNFEECKNAGFPVMESYPEQCRDSNGNLFVRAIEEETDKIKDIPTPVSNKKDSSRIAGGYISGHVDIGPFCPVMREGEPCKVPPEAYTSREVVVYMSDKVTVKERIYLDADGNYKMAIGPGNYFVQIVPAGIGPGEKKPVTVKSFETSNVNFDIDTGIR